MRDPRSKSLRIRSLNSLPLKTIPLWFICVMVITGLSGCSTLKFPGVFKIDIGQGNIVTKEMVDKLKPGMTKRQVQYVMGSPLLVDTFHQNRWDYHYSILIGDQRLAKRHITLLFENDQYVKTVGDVDALVSGTAHFDAIGKTDAIKKPDKTQKSETTQESKLKVEDKSEAEDKPKEAST